jgi:uncharacterized membrane protein YeaQ/YmgE (transglycosylase-associated protein family)
MGRSPSYGYAATRTRTMSNMVDIESLVGSCAKKSPEGRICSRAGQALFGRRARQICPVRRRTRACLRRRSRLATLAKCGCEFTPHRRQPNEKGTGLERRRFSNRRLLLNIIACIVVGILAGWLAERITGRNHGLLTNLIVGIVGAFVGGFFVSSLLGFQYAEGFNLPSILVATIGAVILLAIFGGFRSRRASS